jgi:hypothetical protein
MITIYMYNDYSKPITIASTGYHGSDYVVVYIFGIIENV